MGAEILFCNAPIHFSEMFGPFQMHSNAAQSLCDLIRHGRDQMILEQENCVTDVLLATIQS